MKTQTFGTEIEVNRISREAAARAVAPVLSTDGYTAAVYHDGGSYDAWVVVDREGRKWRFVSDASIAGGRDQGTEFVTPVCRWEDIETVQACVRALRAAGAHADASCGIHVHVGLGNHTPKTLRNLVNLVNAKEDLLTQALQISPERRDRWCRPVDPDFLSTLNRRRPTSSEELARIWYDDRNWEWHAHQHYDPSRYHLLNLHAVWQKGTIEFRAFNSTLHAGEVKAYIQLCLAISHQALTVASASPTRPVTDNPAYTFRCWLLRLGMNGEEFKTARTHLLKHLPGNAAWRNGAETTRRAS
ncbi:MAG: amidoligase family protein [Clostridia bacterium]|nr:amidoligase family protein [Clostridia bacterium]